jgi:hypothetical protein
VQANLSISANIATASSASDMTEKKVAEWSLGPALNELFQNYSANQNHCLLEVFQGPMCRIVRATIQLARQRLATWRERVLAQTGRSLPKAARLSPPGEPEHGRILATHRQGRTGSGRLDSGDRLGCCRSAMGQRLISQST